MKATNRANCIPGAVLLLWALAGLARAQTPAQAAPAEGSCAAAPASPSPAANPGGVGPAGCRDDARASSRVSAFNSDGSVKIELPGSPSYTPLTRRQKFNLFTRSLYSPYTFVNAGFNAGFAQATDDWPSYGQGMEGYGKRFGAILADREAGSFFKTFLFPSLLHQDPRYFRQGKGRFTSRARHAVSRILVTRSDSGKPAFNTSGMLGTLLCVSLSNAYYPEGQRTFAFTMSRFGGSLLSDAQTDLLREFWPDMWRLFRRHEPQKLKRIEQRVEEKVPLMKAPAQTPPSGETQPSAPPPAPAPESKTPPPSPPPASPPPQAPQPPPH